VDGYYTRLHSNGRQAVVSVDVLGLGYGADVTMPTGGRRCLGSWWRLEDAQLFADRAAHPDGCDDACGRWAKVSLASTPEPKFWPR
jgi:hypothetical protein